MADKYPRVGTTERLNPRTRSTCIVCGELAQYRVDVQVSMFRGDDEVVKACREHTKNRHADALIAALYGGAST